MQNKGLFVIDRITSLSGEVWTYIASIISPRYIKVPVPSQDCKRSCICASGIEYACLCDFFSICRFLELFRQCGIFRTVPTVWYF
jgi:hypothetical protein